MAVYMPPREVGTRVLWHWRERWFYGEATRNYTEPGVIVAPSPGGAWDPSREYVWVEFRDRSTLIHRRRLTFDLSETSLTSVAVSG